MNRHAATYPHPTLASVPRYANWENRRRTHLASAIAAPATPQPLHDVVREVLEHISSKGGASVDLVAGRFFVRAFYAPAIGYAVGSFNQEVDKSHLADELQDARRRQRDEQ